MTFEEWFNAHEDGDWKSSRQELAKQAYEFGKEAAEAQNKVLREAIKPIGYPRRGTIEEYMDIFSAARIVQSLIDRDGDYIERKDKG